MNVVRNNLRRHTREVHGDGMALLRRRQQQRSRVGQLRAFAPAGPAPSLDDMLVYVTCPSHRESMWLESQKRLMESGMPASRIRRRFGIDWPSYREASLGTQRRQKDLPAGLTTSQFLMHDFHKTFLPQCRTTFSQHPEVNLVYWVEDDIKFVKFKVFAHIHQVALAQHTCVSWLGYMRVKGRPKWGTHLLGLHRDGLKDLIDQLDAQAEASKAAGTPLSYLMGLDTWVCSMCSVFVGGRAIAKASDESLASQQRGHPFVGRK